MKDHQGGGRRRRATFRLLRAIAAGLTVLLAAMASAGPAFAADDQLPWTATIDDRNVEQSTADAAIPLRPADGVRLTINIQNTGTKPVSVRALRLEGRVIGLSFFSFTTQLGLTVPPDTSARRAIQVDLADLSGQGVGLIPTRLTLIGANREVIGTKSMVADVRGSLNSAYGVFGIAIAVITTLLLIGLALEIARLQLPAHRWRRAVRFLAPGAGIGLTVTFTLSATRILSPDASLWVPLVVGGAGVAFVIGYLTPGPAPDDEDDDVGPPLRRRRSGGDPSPFDQVMG
jgi:hypothetical protein